MTFTGYSINGIALHDFSGRGWRIMRSGTNTQQGVTKTLNKTANPGRPGYTPAPSTWTEGVVVLQMRVEHRTQLDSLLALCRAATTLTRTDDPTKEMYVELASAIPSSDAPYDDAQDVTITLSAWQGVYRDVTAVIVGPTAITSPVQTFDMLSDISADVFDPDVFVRGVFGQFTLVDSGGSFLKTRRAWSGSSSTGLLYIGSTQQAFFAAESDPWTPVSDASQYVDTSPNGGFRLTPQMILGDPASRQVELTLTTLTQTSTTLRVRAKRAYGMN